MRGFLCLAVVGALAACAPPVPDSAGVGFDNSLEAQRAREAALAGQSSVNTLPPAIALSQETLGPAGSVPTDVAAGSSGEDIAAQTAAALSATSNPQPLSATGGATVTASTTGISDENDFEAVSNRQSIESDAARIEANRQQYQVVQPTALPERTAAAAGPNIVSYALATSHPRGTRLYSRTGINLQGKAERNCRNYASPDQAQIDFLEKGGPERDRMGLDPDGDGYACAWDPGPFRSAVQN